MATTATQAIKAALELKGSFNDHELMSFRRKLRGRHEDAEPDIEALGLSPTLQEAIVWMTDEPQQEMHRYAGAFASAEPEVTVFVESEKPQTVVRGEKWEHWYGGAIRACFADTYPYEVHLAGDGVAVTRMDLVHEFWSGQPKRRKNNKNMPAEEYNLLVDENRLDIGLPIEAVLTDPAVFFYDENPKRTRITVGVEVGVRRESVLRTAFSKSHLKKIKSKLGVSDNDFFNPTIPDDDESGGRRVQYVVYRDPDIVYHLILGERKDGQDSTILWEGPNIFGPHTGYILWRARYSGLTNVERRYDPFIGAALNAAEVKSILATLQLDYGIQAAQTWLEKESTQQGPSVSRAISSAAKTAKPQKRTQSGSSATEFGEGESLKYREVAGDLAEVLAMIEKEEERNQFSDALMGEAAASATGRGIVRQQEAGNRIIRQGLKAKSTALQEFCTTLRHTIFNHENLFLNSGRKIVLPYEATGVGIDGFDTLRDVVAIGIEDRIPHTIKVRVEAKSEAAQLGLMEEGLKMEGFLPRDTIDHDFYGIKDIPRENKRRVKDEVRKVIIPQVVKRAAEDAMAIIQARQPATTDVIIPDPEESMKPPAKTGGGQPPGVSAHPTPPQLEDVALTGGGGTIPAPPTIGGQGGSPAGNRGAV